MTFLIVRLPLPTAFKNLNFQSTHSDSPPLNCCISPKARQSNCSIFFFSLLSLFSDAKWFINSSMFCCIISCACSNAPSCCSMALERERSLKRETTALRYHVKMVTCVCVLLAQLEPNNSQSRCVCTQVYCNRKLKETAQEEQGSHRHVCPSSSTIAPVALPPLLAIIASGLGIPHGSRKQQAHSTQSYSQKDPGRV